MFSKALRPASALRHIIKANNLEFIVNLSRYTSSSTKTIDFGGYLHHRPAYSFSKQSQRKGNHIGAETSQHKGKPKELNDEINQFPDYMQSHSTDTTISYTYSNREVFSIKSRYESFKARQRGDLAMVMLMSGAAFVTFMYIHPYVIVVPLWFLVGSLVSLNGARELSKSLVKSMELVSPQQVRLNIISGGQMTCNIEDIEVVGIKEWSPMKDKSQQFNNYIVLGNFKSADGKSQKQLRFIVDSHITKVESVDLFRAILHGDMKEVQKFEYVEPDVKEEDSKEEADSEMQKKKEQALNQETAPQFDFSEEEMSELKQGLKSKQGQKNDH